MWRVAAGCSVSESEEQKALRRHARLYFMKTAVWANRMGVSWASMRDLLDRLSEETGHGTRDDQERPDVLGA